MTQLEAARRGTRARRTQTKLESRMVAEQVVSSNSAGRAALSIGAGLGAPTYGGRATLVRFEDAWGEGLFAVASRFEDYVENRAIRLNRKIRREFRDLLVLLRNSTPIPDRGAYRDESSRRPVTWFRTAARETLRIAERLVQILNQHGADIRRFETDRSPPVLWQDAVQVVTRRPGRPVVEKMDPLQSRRIDRRKRLERMRARAARRRVRQTKSGL